jgi:hypothetical protein
MASNLKALLQGRGISRHGHNAVPRWPSGPLEDTGAGVCCTALEDAGVGAYTHVLYTPGGRRSGSVL